MAVAVETETVTHKADFPPLPSSQTSLFSQTFSSSATMVDLGTAAGAQNESAGGFCTDEDEWEDEPRVPEKQKQKAAGKRHARNKEEQLSRGRAIRRNQAANKTKQPELSFTVRTRSATPMGSTANAAFETRPRSATPKRARDVEGESPRSEGSPKQARIDDSESDATNMHTDDTSHSQNG
jgi:hypothetical protein